MIVECKYDGDIKSVDFKYKAETEREESFLGIISLCPDIVHDIFVEMLVSFHYELERYEEEEYRNDASI